MSGTKFDQEKVDLHVLDPLFVEGTARVSQFGEQKYGRSNWKKGLTQTRIINAIRRHLAQIEKGEDIDDESGFHHAYHIAWGCQVLAYQHRNGQSHLDDRRWSEDFRSDNFHDGSRAGIGGHTVPMLQDGPFGRLHPVDGTEVRLAVSDVQPKANEEKTEDPIQQLQQMISEWADEVYPNRTVENALTKMMLHEIPELLHGKAMDPTEFADVAILLFDIAHLQGIDIVQAMRFKMEVNKKRTWEIDPATGLMSHVKLPETEYLMSGANGDHLKESIGQLRAGKKVPTGFTTDIREPIVRCRTVPTPVPSETTEKVALPPEYPWLPRIPEWATKAEISSRVLLSKLPMGHGLTTAEIDIGHGRPLILIHKNTKNRSHLEKFYCATIKDVETEEEFTVAWDEITPWND